jgi:predicted outer membrane repeat protein
MGSRHALIVGFILLVGLGLAFTLPWLANFQGLAAQSGAHAQLEAPDADRFYVSKTGNGSDGKSWPKAFTRVQDALGASKSGDEIWVAAGIYTPGNTVSDTFLLKVGVELYGGFAATETERTQRDWENNLTILSGDIDGDDFNSAGLVLTPTNIVGDNSYHVVKADGTLGSPVTENTILDGFFITAGKANGSLYDSNDIGGGFYCEGTESGSVCSPKLVNLVFTGNWASSSGGAMYNNGFRGKSSPYLNNVIFNNNEAVEDGGAMYNNGVGGESNPVLRKVEFFTNYAGLGGGGMYNIGFGGESDPDLDGAIFNGNSATGRGGAVYNAGGQSDGCKSIYKNVKFVYNSSYMDGGAMYNDGAGGSCSPVLTGVLFLGNYAGFNGGAMFNNGEMNGISSPKLTNITFSGNFADGLGGAIVNMGNVGKSSPELTNVVFSGNSASTGGAMVNTGNNEGSSYPILTNVTFSGNSADLGGAIYNHGSNGICKPDVRNSIFWNNKGSASTDTISSSINNSSASIKFQNSIVQGSFPGGSWVGGSYLNYGGNIDKDPNFVKDIDPSSAPSENGDLRLKNNSPAINAGKNKFVTVSTDLDNNERINALIVDMGAYEFQFNFSNSGYLPFIYR